MVPLISSLALPALILVSASSLLLIISHSWRWIIFILALQYVGIAFLSAISWPLEMATAKLVSGWMSSAVLGMAVNEATQAAPESWHETESAWPSSRIFRLFAAGLVGLSVFSIAPALVGWIPSLTSTQAAGGLIVIAMGLLHLGLTAHPLRVAIGLLTVLSGFEILYAAVESSALVAGLLAAVHLGLALTGAYLLISPNLEDIS
jgi:hypothetical protein